MRIAIDAMGGDHAPDEIIHGALEGRAFLGDGDQIVLYGREDVVAAGLNGETWDDGRITIEHAADVIEMHEAPVDALKQKRKSSIVLMAKHAAEEKVDAVISAGNTGAFAAACQLKMRTLPGVQRPGIAVVLPSFAGPLTVCDAGANVAPKPPHLLQYAKMATAYAECVLKIASPRVGLLSIGGENVKGNPLVKQSNELLKNDKSLNFVGNVEGREIFSGACDVAVCDGFVGNVVLKLAEGMSEGLMRMIGREVAAESEELAKRFEPIIKAIWQKHDYSEYGGAPLLGVAGSCIICHGSSDRRAIKNAVRVAVELNRSHLNDVITERLAEAS